MDDPDLPSLVSQAQAGDDTAFADLVGRFQAMAYGFAFAILGDFQAAQDAVQDAFVEAYQHLGQLDVPVAFPAWLKRVVLKHCDRQMRRKRPSVVLLAAAENVAAPTPGPEALAEQRSLQQEVLAALGGLSDEQRTVTTLYYIGGYAQSEIAAFLEPPSSTVKSRLHTARQRLRERMMDMVRETLAGNALPESFSEETLARAIAEAGSLNQERRFADAEALLRDVIAKTPESARRLHASALRELNRSLMWGQYADEFFDRRYDELVANGRAILAACDTGAVTDENEPVWRELALTLLYIPRMLEAVEHIKAWIVHKGPDPERLGMLAWARACISDYGGAISDWSSFLELTRQKVDAADQVSCEDAARRIQFVCMTLVDCLNAAARARQQPGLREAAARIAHEGHDAAGALAQEWPEWSGAGSGVADPWPWVGIYHDAGLDWQALARFLVQALPIDRDSSVAGVALGLRTFYDDAAAILADWAPWVRERVERGAWKDLEAMRTRLRGFIAAGRPQALYDAAATAIAALRAFTPDEAEAAKRSQSAIRAWGWVRYDVFAALHSGDIALAKQAARDGAEALGLAESGSSLVIVATVAGDPTPPEVIALIERDGPRAIDRAGMFGWYAIAREEAAAGNTERALDALHRALEGWCNPPLSYLEQWENDPRLGGLREDPRRKALFSKRRAVVGPVYGQLHYFPGW